MLHNFSNFIGSFVTIFACVFALQNPAMDAGAVGLSISYACECHDPLVESLCSSRTVSFTDHVLWIVRMYAACEMSMNSVERVGECGFECISQPSNGCFVLIVSRPRS